MVVMPGNSSAHDPCDLVRCTPLQLADHEWWKAHDLDLVLLYAWGDPKYQKIAKAIMQAGITLVQSLDTAGLPTPYANFQIWLKCAVDSISMPQSAKRRLRLLIRSFRDLVPAIYEHKRVKMINTSGYVAAISPAAMKSISDYAYAMNCDDIVSKLVLCPHPVSPFLRYRGEKKERRVVVVGRWTKEDAGQKNPNLTLKVLRNFLHKMPGWQAEVIGKGSDRLRTQTHDWNEGVKVRIVFREFIDHKQLIKSYVSSRILLCASRYESFHIASAEAVCCGCTIVVGKHPLLASTAWFTTHSSGTLAESRNETDLTRAIHTEALQWENGNRIPETIASFWSNTLHATKIACNLASRIRRSWVSPT